MYLDCKGLAVAELPDSLQEKDRAIQVRVTVPLRGEQR